MKFSFNRLSNKPWYCVLIMLAVFSCDLFEKDAVPDDQSANVVQHDFYVLPNSSAVFDLRSLVTAQEEISVSITDQPNRGSLNKLTESIYRFDPLDSFTSGKDQFVIAFHRNGATLKSDTVVIIVEQDTTQFPCEIFAVEDLVSTNVGEEVIIPVLQNDRVCGFSRNSLTIEIHTFPSNGEAKVTEDSIYYRPETGFSGKDQFIYKISVPDHPVVLGLVTVQVGAQPCGIQLNPDHFTSMVTDLTLATIDLSVVANDQLCSIDTAKASFTIVKQPGNGTLNVVRFGHIQYTTSAPVTQDMTDSLTYEICFNNKCYETGVRLSFIHQACTIKAVNDTVDIRDSTSVGIIQISILNNDELCGGIESLEFIDGPDYGTLYPYDNSLGYLPDPVKVENDSITYRVCMEPPNCSEAKVYIIRK